MSIEKGIFSCYTLYKYEQKKYDILRWMEDFYLKWDAVILVNF